MVNARIKLNKYSNRVLNVFKAKFDLRNKTEAINKFLEIYGSDILGEEKEDLYLKDFNKKVKNYLKENPKLKGISKKEFNELFNK
jgi:hypothetical protein